MTKFYHSYHTRNKTQSTNTKISKLSNRFSRRVFNQIDGSLKNIKKEIELNRFETLSRNSEIRTEMLLFFTYYFQTLLHISLHIQSFIFNERKLYMQLKDKTFRMIYNLLDTETGIKFLRTFPNCKKTIIEEKSKLLLDLENENDEILINLKDYLRSLWKYESNLKV